MLDFLIRAQCETPRLLLTALVTDTCSSWLGCLTALHQAPLHILSRLKRRRAGRSPDRSDHFQQHRDCAVYPASRWQHQDFLFQRLDWPE